MQVTWPVVALAGLVLAAIVAILALVPADDAQGRSVVMMLVQSVVTVLGALFVARRVENAVQQQQQDPDEPTDPPAPRRPRETESGPDDRADP